MADRAEDTVDKAVDTAVNTAEKADIINSRAVTAVSSKVVRES